MRLSCAARRSAVQTLATVTAARGLSTNGISSRGLFRDVAFEAH
jgi:hypothetical protein